MDYNKTDPEFVERVTHFISEEVKKEPGQELDDSTRYLAVLAALAGCQGTGVYEELLPIALDAGLSPVAVKEMVYQSVDYLGLGRMWPFLRITNEIMERRGIALPLESQAVTNMEDRLEKWIQAQAEIFGDRMKEAWKAVHINLWLRASADLPCQSKYERGK